MADISVFQAPDGNEYNFKDATARTVMTGAGASTAGTSGQVPAPAAGANGLFLQGDGTWSTPTGTKPISVPLDTVTNVSGSYEHTTEMATTGIVFESMKPIFIQYGDPSVFRDDVTITTADDEITLSCNEVVGTSTVTVILMDTTPASSAQAQPVSVTSAEYDILADRIGSLEELETTAQTDTVSAINEVVEEVGTLVVDNLTTDDSTKALSAKQGKELNDKINSLNVYKDGDYCYVPVVNLCYATNTTTIRIYLPPDKQIPSSGLVHTADFSVTAIYPVDSTTAVSTTSAVVGTPARASSFAEYVDISGLSGLTANKTYRVTIGGNRRIKFTAAT